MRSILRSGAVVAASSLVYMPAVRAGFAINLQPPATVIAHRIYELHTLVLSICAGIFVVVFGAMFYAVPLHCKSASRAPAGFLNNRLEIAWTSRSQDTPDSECEQSTQRCCKPVKVITGIQIGMEVVVDFFRCADERYYAHSK